MMANWLWLLVPYLIAWGCAAALCVGAFMYFRLAGALRDDTRASIGLLLIAFGAMLTIGLYPRDLGLHTAAGHRQMFDDYVGGIFASRALNALLVGTAIVEIARGWRRERQAAQSDPAHILLLGVALFYLGRMAVQLGSDHPAPSLKTLYAPLVLLALAAHRIETLTRVITAAKLALLALMTASLGMALLRPHFALETLASPWMPALDVRLYGLTLHPNTLGPAALLALVLEWHSPSRWWLLRWLSRLSALAVLVLAQSKTAWAAGLIVLAFVALPLQVAANGDRQRAFVRSVLALVLAITAAIVLCASLAFIDIDRLVQRAGLDTLSGRTLIWDLTLRAWRDNPLFGYGPEVWGVARRIELQMPNVGLAHNQLVQTLGESGLLGALLLAAYLGMLLTLSLRCLRASRGLPLSITLIVLACCVSEAPMSETGVLIWPVFRHALLLIVLAHHLRRSVPQVVTAPLHAPAAPWLMRGVA